MTMNQTTHVTGKTEPPAEDEARAFAQLALSLGFSPRETDELVRRYGFHEEVMTYN